MMTRISFRILGCGSSGGVPRLGNYWGKCDPDNPRNRRRRCSLLIQQSGNQGITRVLIDVSPDVREQLLDSGVGELDAVLISHAHADHVNGFDDLRVISINMRALVQVWADRTTRRRLSERFGYALKDNDYSKHDRFVELHAMTCPVTVHGAGGPIEIIPFSVQHGSITCLGFRIGQLAYMPDVSDIPDDVWPMLKNLDCWIVDALQPVPHPAHSHLEQTIEWIRSVKPTRAYLTNMHTSLDYETVMQTTPGNIAPAHDGLTIEYSI